MPALNYKKQFAPSVKGGTKRQTIRAKRKVPIKRGDTLHHYTGMRTRQCRKLGEDVCVSMEDIFITADYVKVNWRSLDEHEVETLAIADGFDSAASFLSFFRETHGLPFSGDLIRW